MNYPYQPWAGLAGFAITPPVIGRISIGKVVERNGRRLPERSDEFQVTTQIRTPTGWLLHPLDEALRADAPNNKLRSIPVRLLFDDPDLSFRASYTAFDRTMGRPVCAGNGRECQRQTDDGTKILQCPGPERCEFGAGGTCKAYGRLYVLLGDDDPTGVFVLRTTSFNTIRTLTARLHYFAAMSGGVLSCLPLELRLRGKSTAQSHGAPVYYVDLVLRQGTSLVEAIQSAKEQHRQRQDAGHDQAALDRCAWEGLSRGLFEEQSDEGAAVVEEFYPAEPEGEAVTASRHVTAKTIGAPSASATTLLGKLVQRQAMAEEGDA